MSDFMQLRVKATFIECLEAKEESVRCSSEPPEVRSNTRVVSQAQENDYRCLERLSIMLNSGPPVSLNSTSAKNDQQKVRPKPEASALPEGWLSTVDAVTRATYYYNTKTNEVQWQFPQARSVETAAVSSQEVLPELSQATAARKNADRTVPTEDMDTCPSSVPTQETLDEVLLGPVPTRDTLDEMVMGDFGRQTTTESLGDVDLGDFGRNHSGVSDVSTCVDISEGDLFLPKLSSKLLAGHAAKFIEGHAEAKDGEEYTGKPGEATTMMICNLPCRVTRNEMTQILDEMGFAATYDFLHMPTGRANSYSCRQSNLGYGFINFLDPDIAVDFMEKFSAYHFTGYNSTKHVMVKPAHIQGLDANLRRLYAGRRDRLERIEADKAATLAASAGKWQPFIKA
jgi:hypothetical protein